MICMTLERALEHLAYLSADGETPVGSRGWRIKVHNILHHAPTKKMGAPQVLYGAYSKHSMPAESRVLVLAAYSVIQHLSDPYSPFGKARPQKYVRQEAQRKIRRELAKKKRQLEIAENRAAFMEGFTKEGCKS